MKKLIKKILNVLIDMTYVTFGLLVLTVLFTVAAAIFISLFVIFIPYMTISNMINWGMSLVDAFTDSLEDYFDGIKESLGVFKDVES